MTTTGTLTAQTCVVADLAQMVGVRILSLGPVDFPAPARVMSVEAVDTFFMKVTVGEDISIEINVPQRAPVTLSGKGGF